MKIITGNIFNQPTKHDKTEAICVTTNGMIKSNGHAVMGRGIALAVNNRYHVSLELAKHIRQHGNVPGIIGCSDDVYIISFPTKDDWRNDSDIKLIEQSARHIVSLANEYGLTNIYLTKPGCANGHLDWNNVRSVIEPILDDRFTIVDIT